MKHKLLLIIGISLFANLSAQNKSLEIKPKRMIYMHDGSFVKGPKPNGETINVNAFWVGNEVTNAEYAEFINYAKAHPDEELLWINLKNPGAYQYRNFYGSADVKDEYKTGVKYSDIKDDLIDLDQQPYEDYFGNKKYANYPVVGISNQAARWYCAWKTEMEVKMHTSKGWPIYFRYRLPTEDEWLYLASQIKKTHSKDHPEKIAPSRKGKTDIKQIYHLLDNVSEWITTEMDANAASNNIAKGGSWCGKQGIFESQSLDENTSHKYIGFRVVRPNMLCRKKGMRK
jgi:formylglycine-generating enzyme required for sulfatase activity